jgi:branched-chain amino acid transport system permease protein
MSQTKTASRGGPVLSFREGSTQHRSYQIVSWALVFLVAIILPYLLPNFRTSQFAQAFAFGVAILGMNMAIGFSGLLSIGHIAFMGTGAYTTMILINDNRWDMWMTLPIVALVCFLFGVLVGLPALKIRGLYLALVTFSLAYTFPILLKIEQGGIARRTGGDNGKNLAEVLFPPSWARSILGLNGRKPQEAQAIYLYFCLLGILIITFILVRNIMHSRAGRGIIAIRDNQIGAAVSGVNLNFHKVVTFGISAAVTGIGGSMLAVSLNSVGPSSFDANYAILTLVGLVLGGVATLHGSWLGGIILVFLQDLASRVTFTAIPFFKIERGSPLTRAVFGLVLVLVAFFAPGGSVAFARMVRSKVIRVIPRVPTPPGTPLSTEAAPIVEEEEESLTGAAR